MTRSRLLASSVPLLLLLLSWSAAVLGQSGDSQVAGIVPRAPFFNLDFSSSTNVNPSTLYYTYTTGNDPLDAGTAAASVHTGVAVLNGSSTSYIDLSQSSGPNSAGMVLPPYGGPSAAPASALYGAGWTLEIVFKLTATSTWAKIVDLGTGASLDNTILGFDGNDLGRVSFEQWNTNSLAVNLNNFAELIKTPVLGQWYHVAVVMNTVNAATYTANWQFYINGKLQPWATQVVPNMSYTYIQGANLAQAVNRTGQYIGKSNWNDPYCSVNVDALRIYDYALTGTTVTALSTAYGLAPDASTPGVVPASSAISTTSTEYQSVMTALGSRSPPIFNGLFDVNPTTLSTMAGTSTTNYQWLQSDPSDSPSDQTAHKGLLVFTGTANSFVDLAVNSGPNSVGQTLPIFGGAGSGTAAAGNQGFSIEFVIKLTGFLTWSKIFDFSDGPGLDLFGVTWNGNSYSQVEVQSYNNIWQNVNGVSALTETEVTFIQSPAVLHVWYHVAIVLSNPVMSGYQWVANWNVYVNGQRAVSGGRNIYRNGTNIADPVIGLYPLPVYRQFGYISRSAWTDPPAAFTLDALRVYDYALDPTVITALATVYGLNVPVPTKALNQTSNPAAMVPTAEDTAVAAAVSRLPVFNASFGVDPQTFLGIPSAYLGYQWAASDTSVPGQNHQGVITFTGQAGSYIDLTAGSGPNSIGLVLPQIGGAGNYPYGNTLQGWTFEIVVKLNASSMGTWAKLFDIGDGSGVDNLVFGWYGSDYGKLDMENHNAAGSTTNFQDVTREFLRNTPLSTWMHVVWGIQAVGYAPGTAMYGAANWYIWINGQPQLWSDGIVPGTAYTWQQGASFPLSVVRNQAYIARSDWNDPLLTASFDAFRVYDYLLTTTQVQALANVYGLNVAPTPDSPV